MNNNPEHSHAGGDCEKRRELDRRHFLKLGGGLTASLTALPLLPAEPFAAGASPTTSTRSAQDDLAGAYREHLRVTKGILDIRTLHKSGDGPNWLDVVVVSAGFTGQQMGEFHGVCEKFVKAMFSRQPWQRYQSLINVHAVFVEDKDADTSRVKASGYKGNILSCDNGAAVEYSRYAAQSAATVVIHNSGFSTAGTGVWGVATLNKACASSPMAPVHELGHGFAGLGDEYIQRNKPFDADPKSIIPTINVTNDADPRRCKWHYWTREEWPGVFGPSVRPKGVNVANFEGAGWIKGIYRPQEKCLMRCNCDAFCVVCSETMEANIFRYIDPFTVVQPAEEDVVLWKGQPIEFRVAAIDLLRRKLEWLKSRLSLYLDGKPLAVSEQGEVSFRFDGMKPGVYQVGTNLIIQSQQVRRDFGFLSSGRGWRVRAMDCTKPELSVKPLVTVAPDGSVDVPVEIRHEKPTLFEVKMIHAPAGATLTDGRFAWKPAGKTGAWRVEFSAMLGQHVGATAAIEIQVTASGKQDMPELQPIAPVEAVTGKPLKLQLKAAVKDGGHLLFEPVEILPGAELDRYSGELQWTPLPSQAGPKRLRFRVKNGPAFREMDVIFYIRREATPSPVSYCNRYIPQSLETLKRLKSCPALYRRLFETLRLLRDRYEPVYQAAFADAKAMFQEFPAPLRENGLEELHLHAWEFADKPDFLNWMREIATSETPQASLLKKRLEEIAAYNAERMKEATSQPTTRTIAKPNG